jgi:hypothetical protein
MDSIVFSSLYCYTFEALKSSRFAQRYKDNDEQEKCQLDKMTKITKFFPSGKINWSRRLSGFFLGIRRS